MTANAPARLRIVEGIRSGDSIPLTCQVGDVWSIGRALENTICLTDAEVSRHHATVTFDGNSFTLTDNRSTNGTFVNGTFTPQAALKDGDEVRFGDAVLRFELLAAPSDETLGESATKEFVADAAAAAPEVNFTLAVSDHALQADRADTEDFAELQRAHERLAVVHSINQAVAAAPDQQRMLDKIMEELARLKGFDRGFILLASEGGPLTVRAKYTRPGVEVAPGGAVISRTVLDQVVNEGMAVLSSDLQNDPRFDQAESIRLGRVRSAISVPLVAHGEVLGVLHLDSESLHNAFVEQDLHLFSTIANDISIALANQRMRDQLLERQRLEHELLIASQIQQNFLPTHVPGNAKIQLSARNVPALEVGGDYYDYFHLGDEQIGMVVGDVSGKGVPAALLMVKAMTEFRSRVSDTPTSTAAAVADLNGALVSTTLRGMFITLVYLIIDTAAMTVRYTSAGHLPPLLLPAEGPVQSLTSARGVPVGIVEGAEYEEAVVNLQPGDTLCLVTDGVAEARNSAGTEMGEERVLAAADRHRGSPDALVDGLVGDTLAFVGAAPQHDDITVLAVCVS